VVKRKHSSKSEANADAFPAKLTDVEQDLLSHIEHGYQLETDLLGGDPVLRHSKDNEVIRPASANRNTIKALEQRGLISSGKGHDPLTLAWRLKKKARKGAGK
jgi:hypothetical protein